MGQTGRTAILPINPRLRRRGSYWSSCRGADENGRRARSSGHRFERIDVDCSCDRVIDSRVDAIDEGQEFVQLDRECVRDVDDILVPHLETSRQKIYGGVAEIEVVDDRNNRSLEA